jgi:amidohydrolase
MHACGHDAHTAILMGAASVLAGMRERLPGTVVLLFQPAEEGPPTGERGGAALMLEEGALADPTPAAIFGLHTFPGPPGFLGYREGGIMAGSDYLEITVRGRQTHGAVPWAGVDPIVVASQIVLGLQTIPSRQMDATSATIVTIGSIQGGIRNNIIPEEVKMLGTIRYLDPNQRDDLNARIRRTAENIAASAGAKAEVVIRQYGPVTFNDPELTRRMAPTLRWAAADSGAGEVPPVTPSEDFSHFQQRFPGLYFFLGINDQGVATTAAAPNHSPRFYINEEALVVGVRAMAGLAVDYLSGE